MPKKVIEKLLSAILDDISLHFAVGARYRSVREIAGQFGVSLQTAQRAVREMAARNVLSVQNRSGIYVQSVANRVTLEGKSIMVVSANADPRFNDAFLHGIREISGPLLMGTSLLTVRNQSAESLEFAETLQERMEECRAIGLVALAFRGADLPFYHLMNAGHLIISDVASHRLPTLPSVQTDNRRHSAEAAREFAAKGKRTVLIAGYWPAGNTRHTTFMETFTSIVPGATCRYLHLADDLSIADLYMFFNGFSAHDGVYAIDYAANHTVAPYFLSHRISPVDNLIVYDSEFESFAYRGLPPIRAAAPSLSTLGRRLAEKLVDRIRIGSWQEPQHELL